MIRALKVVAPFALIAIGVALVYASPWLNILHLMRTGARVRVVWRWETAGLPILAALCWIAAIWLSLQVKRGD